MSVDVNADLPIESRYLPPILQEIAGLIGLPATLALVKHAGGTRLYVPVKYDPCHPLVKVLGHAAAVQLIEKYPAQAIDLPKGEIAVKAARDQQIRADRHVYTQAQQAIRWGLTDRQIRSILGPAERDDKQAGLF